MHCSVARLAQSCKVRGAAVAWYLAGCLPRVTICSVTRGAGLRRHHCGACVFSGAARQTGGRESVVVAVTLKMYRHTRRLSEAS